MSNFSKILIIIDVQLHIYTDCRMEIWISENKFEEYAFIDKHSL